MPNWPRRRRRRQQRPQQRDTDQKRNKSEKEGKYSTIVRRLVNLPLLLALLPLLLPLLLLLLAAKQRENRTRLLSSTLIAGDKPPLFIRYRSYEMQAICSRHLTPSPARLLRFY